MIDEYIRYLKKDRKRISTISLYAKIVNEFVDWYTQSHSCEFHCLKRKDVLEFKNYLEVHKKFKLETIKVKMSAIVKFNQFLVHCKIQKSMVL